MMHIKPKWRLEPPNHELSKSLSNELNIHPITAQILINRGIRTRELGEQFLSPRLKGLPDPSLLPDMEKATDRILKTIKGGERMAIFGDYDADGVTATALLVKFLKACGADCISYIPNRLSEGYGLSREGIDKIHKEGVSLIITADNGTHSLPEIDHANGKGIDVIVTDHHEIQGDLPAAYAIVNPKRMRGNGQFRELAGVGVAFYLAAALRSGLREEKLFKEGEPDLKTYLDLVALGTVADVAPLSGINRTLVKFGIEALKRTENIGIMALATAADMDLTNTNTGLIAFRLAPRINAAGRLGEQNIGLRLLLTDDVSEAIRLSTQLNQMNSERQSLEKKIIKDMEPIIEEMDTTRSSIILWSDKWHPGVIGIVASRIADAHRKPCVIISVDNGIGRGSVRSIGNFNVMEPLSGCEDILINYGGHMAAAGFDIDAGHIEEFRERFEGHTSSKLTEEDRTPLITLDAEIHISAIGAGLVEELASLEPFGEGNPQPILATNACGTEDVRRVGTNHLKFRIDGLDAIGFGLGDVELEPDKEYQFAGIPQFNEWNGTTSIQFKVKDIRETFNIGGHNDKEEENRWKEEGKDQAGRKE